MLRLVTIPISHYCEKARWALERAGLGYREERHVQFVHRFAARRAGGGSTVPVLVTPDGVLGESEEILAWVDARLPEAQRLFPADPALRREVLEVCRRLDGELGPEGRRLMYSHMLEQRELMLRVNCQGVPAWERRALAAAWPLAVRHARRYFGLVPGRAEEAEARTRAEFDAVAARLDGSPHLCGDRFTAADLTFASLAAAVIVPPRYGVALPQPEELPAATAVIVRRFREHPAGRYALDLFAARPALGSTR